MFSLFKKEIILFLGSLTGYLVVVLFLLVAGLFLWVFPGGNNIPENGYATLEGLFSLAPWLYLFLVPAITMRFFADERRSGNLEVLLTHPVSDWKIVVAKYFAGLFLVSLSLLPTLLWFLSVYLLGNPVGNIDTGATWGAFIGLFFLASIYISIGVFASSVTDNQIVAFVIAVAVSFLFYLGFDFVGSAGIPYFLEQVFSSLSIDTHYQSVSRGVIDMRDMFYFIGITLFFLYLTRQFLRRGNWRKGYKIRNTVLFFAGLAIVLFASSFFLFRADLTTDKRYSLSPVSKMVAAEIENPVEVELYLSGELEPGLRALQKEIVEKIAVLNVYAPKPIRLKITDPYGFSNAGKRNRFQESLMQKGVKPISFNRKTTEGISSRYIFPGAVIRMGNKEIAANFLVNNSGFQYEVNYNRSMEGVEYRLVNAIHKLKQNQKPVVAFLEGQGEYNQWEVQDFNNTLTEEFVTKRIPASALVVTNDPEVLIVAGPIQPFSETDKYYIDQYIMRGGKVVWLIDPVQVSLDSLANGYLTYAFPRDINLGDQLFRYGVRLNYVLLQDVDCARILVNTAPPGVNPQWNVFPWYYSPLLAPSDDNPVTRNLDLVLTEFVASVDTISGDGNVKKTVLLTTSPYAREVKSPSSVSLQNISNPPARELFRQSFIPVGVLLEGSFNSVFENRLPPGNIAASNSLKKKSLPTKMVVIADGGIIANKVNYSRTYKMRLLDKVKLREQKQLWQWINTGLPVLLIMIFGTAFNIVRKYRYNRS
ncbi:MAG: gliding motility-associated ABC transporter substrate-binding protein GldG [Draconibacterium sp.]|nr:MAG: gliding motility-associated ABC transporter substrate-binding protein GldG [Draconibacterium sp.]